jgi:type II secretory pathway component GspD/PulD (secretin)
VFIQPTVVNNPAEAQALLESKQDQVDQIKAGKIKMYEKQPDSTGPESKQ